MDIDIYNIKEITDKIKYLRFNLDADKKILFKYISSYYYSYIFFKYRNDKLIIELLKISNDVKIQEKYNKLTLSLIKKFVKTKDINSLNSCVDIIDDLNNFQSNRDKYFFHLRKVFHTSISNKASNFVPYSEPRNLDDYYINKIDKKFRKVMYK